MTSAQADRFDVVKAGFTGDHATARKHLSHSDATVRASALRALHRLSDVTDDELMIALADQSADVRRTAVEFATHTHLQIHHLLADSDVFVCEMTAWSLGERTPVTDEEIAALIHHTTEHSESVVREACAAALGSIGDARGLPAILAACTDKPAVRRRAVLALAPFDGPEVEAALQSALTDRDWQVRQNAEILLNPRD